MANQKKTEFKGPWKFIIDGKWQGGSHFGTKKQVTAKAESLRKHPSQDIKVEPKGVVPDSHFVPDDKAAEAEPEPAPEAEPKTKFRKL